LLGLGYVWMIEFAMMAEEYLEGTMFVDLIGQVEEVDGQVELVKLQAG